MSIEPASPDCMANTRVQLYHNLSVVLAAGVPLIQSLRTAASGLRGRLPKALLAVARDISAGQGLCEAMAGHPKAFATLDMPDSGNHCHRIFYAKKRSSSQIAGRPGA